MDYDQEIIEQDELSRSAHNTVIAIVVGGVVLIAAAYIGSNNLREASEKRLKLEEGVTAAWNEQFLSIQAGRDRIKKEAEERDFNRLLYGTSQPPPSVVLRQIEENTRKIAEQNANRRDK